MGTNGNIKKGPLELLPSGTQGINPGSKVVELPSELKRLRLPIIISPSEVELTHRCHRRHILGDILRIQSYQSPSATFGTHLHRGAETWWNLTAIEGKDHLPSITESVAAALDSWTVPEGSYHTKDLMSTMVQHYCQNAKLQGDLPGPWTLVNLETRYLAEIEYISEHSNIFALTYQTDRLLQSDKDPNTYAIIDLKSASKLSEYWDAGMNRSIQQRLYNILSHTRLEREQDGEVTVHSIVEGIQKKDAVKMKYVWPSLTWTPGILDESINLAIQAAQMDEGAILGMLTEGNQKFADSPPDLENAEDVQQLYEFVLELAATQSSFNYMDCRSYYFDCPYLSVCDSDPDDRLQILLDQFQHVEQRISL